MADYIIALRDKGFVKGIKINLKEHKSEAFEMHKKPYLLVEGFLIYAYESLGSLIDYKFYIDIPDEEILKRRKVRPLPPHVDESFMKIGMDEYRRYGSMQKYLSGVIVLDGMKDPKYLTDQILQYLQKHL